MFYHNSDDFKPKYLKNYKHQNIFKISSVINEAWGLHHTYQIYTETQLIFSIFLTVTLFLNSNSDRWTFFLKILPDQFFFWHLLITTTKYDDLTTRTQWSFDIWTQTLLVRFFDPIPVQYHTIVYCTYVHMYVW